MHTCIYSVYMYMYINSDFECTTTYALYNVVFMMAYLWHNTNII